MVDTKVINIGKTSKEYMDVYIGRGKNGKHMNNTPPIERGWLGNPYRVGKDGSRDEVIRKFRDDFFGRVSTDDHFREEILKLKGKTLGCWCKPKPCHGDVIVAFINRHDHAWETFLR